MPRPARLLKPGSSLMLPARPTQAWRARDFPENPESYH
jgi:hypothetical protein